MINGQYSILLNYSQPIAAECYSLLNMYCYMPSSIVEYRRNAYIAEGNKTRVTFDSDIKVTESHFDLFLDELNLFSVLYPDRVLLEVKYNGFMYEYINDALAYLGKEKISYSKYEMSKRIMC